jgi:lipid II:glycine glycyltransferase (peptidoglycan interpeptide bridge formation enzyme)
MAFRDQLLYKFNASDPDYLHLRPNNLLLWHAMQYGAASGCRTLDLGRCDEDNEGLRRFKLLWGSREERLGYYQYHPAGAKGRTAILSARPARAALSFLVKHVPDFALQGMGAMLYGNFG